jgi:hypothetical protein
MLDDRDMTRIGAGDPRRARASTATRSTHRNREGHRLRRIGDDRRASLAQEHLRTMGDLPPKN